MWCCASALASAALSMSPLEIYRPGSTLAARLHFKNDDRVSFFFSSRDGNGRLNVRRKVQTAERLRTQR